MRAFTDIGQEYRRTITSESSDLADSTGCTPDAQLRELIKVQQSTLEQIEKHFSSSDESEEEREVWQKLARVLDRLFLLLYVLCFVVITVVFFVQLSENDG